MANKYMEKILASLTIRGRQIKTAMRYDFTPVCITIFKKINDIEKREPLHTVGGNVN
jgi:hypothetical protein